MHGIGACSKALERLGIEHEIVDAVEIDKYAIKSFNAIHGTEFEEQDITKWDKDVEVDLIMHGSPCQDFSVAGKQAGGDVGSGTRSSLMYETIRIVGKLRPKYVVWENVKNLLSKKHRHNFDAYIETMNILGYNSYYQVLNAKDYGIPQNRERVFTISIRKDIDKGSFTFPQKEPLKLRLKDMLEEQVDEKYYLSDEKVNTFSFSNKKEGVIGHLKLGNFEINNRVYGIEEISWTLRGKQPDQKILVKNATKKGYDEVIESEGLDPTLTHQEEKNTDKQDYIIIGSTQKHAAISYNGITPTLTSAMGTGGGQVPMILSDNSRSIKAGGGSGNVPKAILEEKEYERTPLKFLNRNQKNIEGDYAFCVDSCNTGGVKEIEGSNLRIRKLTPLETWRLMGFDDEDFEKAKTALNEKFYKGKDKSSSQLYKQAGNSIVVNVLEKIFSNLLKGE